MIADGIGGLWRLLKHTAPVHGLAPCTVEPALTPLTLNCTGLLFNLALSFCNAFMTSLITFYPK